MTTTQQVYNYFQEYQMSNIIKVEPFSDNGTQDPISWLTTFEKTIMVN